MKTLSAPFANAWNAKTSSGSCESTQRRSHAHSTNQASYLEEVSTTCDSGWVCSQSHRLRIKDNYEAFTHRSNRHHHHLRAPRLRPRSGRRQAQPLYAGQKQHGVNADLPRRPRLYRSAELAKSSREIQRLHHRLSQKQRSRRRALLVWLRAPETEPPRR